MQKNLQAKLKQIISNIYRTYKQEIDQVAIITEVTIPLMLATIATESLGNPKAIRYVSHLFAWGQDNKKLWHQYPDLPYDMPIHVTGNPRSDMLRPELKLFYEDEVKKILGIPENVRVSEFAEKVKASGGEIREQKQSIPGVGYLVMCKDSDGNTFGIMQVDDTAK